MLRRVASCNLTQITRQRRRFTLIPCKDFILSPLILLISFFIYLYLDSPYSCLDSIQLVHVFIFRWVWYHNRAALHSSPTLFFFSVCLNIPPSSAFASFIQLKGPAALHGLRCHSFKIMSREAFLHPAGRLPLSFLVTLH